MSTIDTEDTPTHLQKKQFIKNAACDLPYEDRLKLLEVLRQRVPDKIVENSDGSHVNLDKMSDGLITNIYHIVVTKTAAMTSELLQ
jgi:hypothetical protein